MFTIPTNLPDDPVLLQQMLRAAVAEIQRQRLIIAALQRNRFGRRSEKGEAAVPPRSGGRSSHSMLPLGGTACAGDAHERKWRSTRVLAAEHDTLIETGEQYRGGVEPLITIAVTLFNYEQFIRSTLADVAAQTHPCLELVIVDDYSTDNSTSIARAWIEKNFARFSSSRMVRHRLNQGVAQSRNTAFRLATSEYVFVLDADNGIYPRAIARLFEALKVSGQAGAYSQLELFGDQIGVGQADIWDPEQFSRGNYIDAMALVTKSAWMAVGGYSYMDVVGWEDFDFWCKFIDAGLRCVYVPEILCRYRIHDKSMLRRETYPRLERACQEMVLRHPGMTFSFEAISSKLRP